jgi:hypothetical protein
MRYIEATDELEDIGQQQNHNRTIQSNASFSSYQRAVGAKTEPLGEVVVLSGYRSRSKNGIQRNSSLSDLVILKSVPIYGPDIQIVLTRADIKAKGLTKDRAQALGVLGSLLVITFKPHLDKRVRLAEKILVTETSRVVELNVELALLGGID